MSTTLQKQRTDYSTVEQAMIWQKPASHVTSEQERRIANTIIATWQMPEMRITNLLLEGDAGSGKTQLAKALSADLQLPYTKITCFADMDKSDILGSLLPVLDEDSELQTIFDESQSQAEVISRLADHLKLSEKDAKAYLQHYQDSHQSVSYRFYPSEIVKAVQNGYLLEIQEPTVIRDASVLVALNSVLEPNGTLETLQGRIRRHPDTVVVLTTNRNYQGNRPLNESLRDRMQYSEKMDLPTIPVMVARASAKSGLHDEKLLTVMANIIRLLDETAKANGIHGVAGMRSYLYWSASTAFTDILKSFDQMVLYKITTDELEIELLKQAIVDAGLWDQLVSLATQSAVKRTIPATHTQQDVKPSVSEPTTPAVADQNKPDRDSEADKQPISPDNEKSLDTKSEDNNVQPDGDKVTAEVAKRDASLDVTSTIGTEQQEESFHEGETLSMPVIDTDAAKQTRKTLNQSARESLKNTIHAREGLIVHVPKITPADVKLANEKLQSNRLITDQLVRQMREILQNEHASDVAKGKVFGQQFDASKVVNQDFGYFTKKRTPDEDPSLAIAIRVDQSASMVEDNRIKHEQTALFALTAFCRDLNIPLTINGDTADVSERERTSIYAYKEFNEDYDTALLRLTTIKALNNNRDGSALKILADKLAVRTEQTKLLINLSDGQPKAMPNYTGDLAKDDLQQIVHEAEREGIVVLSAALGDDAATLKEIYGNQRFLDFTDLNRLATNLVHIVMRFV